MAQETAVTAPPIGASRSQDWYINEDGNGFQAGAVVRGRLVGVTDPSSSSSNGDAAGAGMVLSGAYNFGPVQVGGKWMRAVKMQGDMCFSVIPLTTFTPTLRDMSYPLGRYVWEGLFHWPTNPGVNTDSGLLLSPLDHARMLLGGANGVLLGNRNGVLSLTTRGVGGLEVVDVSAFAGALNLWNKLTLIVRQPGLNRPASITALVNDRTVFARSYVGGAHHLPITTSTLAALRAQLIHGTNVTDCWVSQLRFSAGPDVADL